MIRKVLAGAVLALAMLVAGTAQAQRDESAVAAKYEAVQAFFWDKMSHKDFSQVVVRLICLRLNPEAADCSMDGHVHDPAVIDEGLAIARQCEALYQLAVTKKQSPSFAEGALQECIRVTRDAAILAQDRVDRRRQRQ